MPSRRRNTGSVTLIQQNDTHAQVSEHWELFHAGTRDEYRRVGGAARTATLAADIKRANSGTLLVDCGDAIHGTLPAMRSQGATITPVLNAVGVDVMTPGNWEYGFGPEVLRERIKEMSFPAVASNVQDAATSDLLLPPYVVSEVGGLRVGLIGLSSPIIPRMAARFASGLRFPDAVNVLPRYARVLREDEQADLVVLVSHLGFAQDVTLAREVGGVDVILSGHTHNRLQRPVEAGGALIIQSGFSGSFLGVLELEVERGRIVDFSHRLVTLDDAVKPDPAVLALVEDLEAPYRQEMNEVVGRTATPLHRYGLLETSMDNLVTDAYRAFTGADLAISHGWRFAPPVPAGDVRLGDLWAMVPTNPEVFTTKLTGAQLHALVEENMHSVLAGNPLEQAGGYLLRASGLKVVFRPNNPRGTRVESIEVAGRALDPDREYTVAGAGGQDLRGGRDRLGTGLHSVDVITHYLANGEVRADVTHDKFVAW